MAICPYPRYRRTCLNITYPHLIPHLSSTWVGCSVRVILFGRIVTSLDEVDENGGGDTARVGYHEITSCFEWTRRGPG